MEIMYVNKSSENGFYKINCKENGKKTFELTFPQETTPIITGAISELVRFMQAVQTDNYSFSVEFKRITKMNIPVINLIPDNPPANPPLIFLVHGFETSKEKVLRYGIHFASNGYYTVLMDLPDHGERMIPGFAEKYLAVENSPDIWFNRLNLLKKSVEELRLVIDHYNALPEIDNSRIGMTGISMGGTIVLLESYDDSRVKAIAPLLSIVGLDSGHQASLTPDALELVQSIDPLYIYKDKPGAAVLLQFGEKDSITEKPALIEYDEKMKKFFREQPERYSLIRHEDMRHDVSLEMIYNALKWFNRFLK